MITNLREIFTEAPESKLEVLLNAPNCKDYAYDGVRRILLLENDIFKIFPEEEEYELYESVCTIQLINNYVYVIFKSSKILVFDTISHEIVKIYEGIYKQVKQVCFTKGKFYILTDMGEIYHTRHEELQWIRNDLLDENNSQIRVTCLFVSDVILATDFIGNIYANGKKVFKVFECVEMLAEVDGLCFILTQSGILIGFEWKNLLVRFKIQLTDVSYTNQGYILAEGKFYDVRRQTVRAIPRDARNMLMHDGYLVFLTSSALCRMKI